MKLKLKLKQKFNTKLFIINVFNYINKESNILLFKNQESQEPHKMFFLKVILLFDF